MRTNDPCTKRSMIPLAALAALGASMLALPGCVAENEEGEEDVVAGESVESELSSGDGLKAEIFPSVSLTGTPVTRVDGTVNFDWGTGVPASGIGADNFSVRWTGEILPLYSETYTFTTTSDDGVRVWVNGTKIIDNWTDHAAADNSGTIALTAGKRTSIKIEYYERGGGAVMKLAWASARQAKQIVPQSQLFSSSEPPATSTTTCWPYDRPSIATLRASKKKVFAHYFSAYPISLDNQPPESDYYARNYTKPEGENGKFYSAGGLLSQRPLPQAPRAAGTDWNELNMQTEVRRAVNIGLDGFTWDLLGSSGTHWDRFRAMLRAIPKVDAGFKILLTFDMNVSSFGSGTAGSDADVRNAIINVLTQVSSDPSLYRLADGRLVISAYAPEKRTSAWWKGTFDALNARGIRTAFMPMTNTSDWVGLNRDMQALFPVWSATHWSYRTTTSAPKNVQNAQTAHSMGLLWMSPVGPQDARPKNLNYIEVKNSASFRAGWDAAITGGADMIQAITWNDYSEHSEIAPSTKTQTSFYDLTGFYTTWFKQGAQPPIARDTLYYFHRANSVDPTKAPPKKGAAYKAVNGPAGEDYIEVVGLLTAPGSLQIIAGGKTSSVDVGAGVQTLRIPMVTGKPVFRLVRNGAVAAEVTSATTITNTIDFVDPIYHGGASRTCPVAQ